MPLQSWESTLNVPGNAANLPAAVAYNTATALTDVSPGAATNGALIIPANFLDVGSTLRLTASGFFSNTATPTLLLGFYFGAVAGVALAATAATTTTVSAVSWPFRMEYTGTVQVRGSSGKIMGSGYVMLATSLTAYSLIPLPATAIAQVTIDTTTAKAVTVGAQWGTNSVSNTLTVTSFTVESMA